MRAAVPPNPVRERLATHLADVVLILGDVGKMREIAEGADDKHGLVRRHAVEDGLQFATRRLVVVTMKADRGLADAFDQIEHGFSFLIAHGIAENASEQPDVVAQPRIERGGVRLWLANAR